MGIGKNNSIDAQKKISFHIAESFDPNQFILVELHPQLQTQFTAPNSKICIKGHENEKAVLCTEEKTFLLTREDISNTRLVTKNVSLDCDGNEENQEDTEKLYVYSSPSFHYQLTERPTDTTELYSLLMGNPFTIAEMDEDNTSLHDNPTKKRKLKHLYTMEDLLGRIQFSQLEIVNMLDQLNAFLYQGYWRLLDRDLQFLLFSKMLDFTIENDWKVDGNTCSTIEQYSSIVSAPDIIIRQMLHIYSDGSEYEKNGDSCNFQLSPTKVAQFRAHEIFIQNGKEHRTESNNKMIWNEFSTKWNNRLPDGIEPQRDASLLQGIAFIENWADTTELKPSQILRYFPENDLPLDPKSRFDVIFKFQTKWTLQQLEPYIKCLITPKLNQASLLLKYTRSSRHGNSRLYSKR